MHIHVLAHTDTQAFEAFEALFFSILLIHSPTYPPTHPSS